MTADNPEQEYGADERVRAHAHELLATLKAMVAAYVPGHGIPMTEQMLEAYVNATAVIELAEGR